MKTLSLLLTCVMALFFYGKPADAASGNETYRLRPGDVVMISVWREDALQREVRILPDGGLNFPLAGRLQVDGATTTEVESLITDRLKQYISDPVVTVVVSSIDGNRIYVIGKINKPGPIVLSEPMTALQALSMAGGLNTFASGNDIKVLRVKGTKQELLPVNYNDLIKGRNLHTNVSLHPGDTILVP